MLLLRPGLGEPAPPGGARVSERRRRSRRADERHERGRDHLGERRGDVLEYARRNRSRPARAVRRAGVAGSWRARRLRRHRDRRRRDRRRKHAHRACHWRRRQRHSGRRGRGARAVGVGSAVGDVVENAVIIDVGRASRRR